MMKHDVLINRCTHTYTLSHLVLLMAAVQCFIPKAGHEREKKKTTSRNIFRKNKHDDHVQTHLLPEESGRKICSRCMRKSMR